ncbi:MAG: hypothetical protein KGK15_04750 [Burkholderiales bacterium]|nr:hypothetical protein [Burkholderiales bacterium]MDE2609918.1 hypothetical protein [Burkholderiales bacterium]
MQLLEVSPKTGYVWLRQGLWLFRKSPLTFLALLFAYLFAMMAISLLPFVGAVLPLLFIPGLSVGFMAACRDVIKNKPAYPTILIAGFRAHGRAVARRLIALGVCYILAVALVFAVSAVMDGGELFKFMLFGGRLDDSVFETTNLSGAMLVAAIAYIPVAMVFWFAPVLVAWHDLPPIKALFFSWVACWRNRGAFITYALLTGTIATLVPLAMVLLFTALGIGKFASIILMPFSILLTAVLYCSFYATYRGCFGVQEIGAIDEKNVTPPTIGL